MEEYNLISNSIKNNKEDKVFLSQIFNLLTKNDFLKNYSHNNNGIFFNYNSLKKEELSNVIDFIKNYKRIKEEKNNYEKIRTKIIYSQNENFASTMQKLNNEIEKSILHTDLNILNDETDNEMEIDETEISYKELFGESDEE